MSLLRAVPLVVGVAVAASCAASSDPTAPTGAQTTTPAAAPTTETEPAPVREPLSKELPTCVLPRARKTIVAFRARDGVPLVGVLRGSGGRGVVLAHQLDDDLCAWMPYARRLARLGYRVLAFSFRGYAPSGGAVAVPAYDADVAAAVAVLRRRGATRTAAVGASMGGTAALAAAPDIRPRLAAVASLSGPAALDELDARVAVRTLAIPILFLVGRDDSEFALDARRLVRAAASNEKELRVFPGAAHGIDLLTGADGRAARAVLERFLARHLRTR